MATTNQVQDDGYTAADGGTLPPVVVIGTPENYKEVIANGRPKNPLTEYASFTYHLTFYMVTSEAYIRFIDSGLTYIGQNEGFYTVAESGGTGSKSNAPRINPNAEYFIDDLTFKTFCNTKATEAPTNSINFEFKIYEPMGFSFTTVLKQKALEITTKSTIPNIQLNTDPIKQFYVLAISFMGYDDDGNPIDDVYPGIEQGQYTGPSSNNQGSNTSYYPLYLQDFSFKLDGKSTVYTIKATPISIQEAYGVKRNLIPEDREVSGTTVGEALLGAREEGDNPNAKGIVQIMNEREENLVKNGQAQEVNVYNIELSNVIKFSKLTSKERYDKVKSSLGIPTDSSQITGKDTLTNFTYNPNTRSIAVSGGMTLTKFIDNVILQSDYITKALDKIYTEDGVPEFKPSEGNQGSKKLQWFSINPIVKPKAYDPLRNDYVFYITYRIQPYQIPYIKSTFVNPTNKTDYYGPFKVYNYYFTGLNTEVLSFETSYNNLYFLPGGSDNIKEQPNADGDKTPIVPGAKNVSLETLSGKAGIPVGSIKTNLYSPGDTIKAKLQILGDPDFLMTTIGTSKNASTPREAAYGPNLSINPLGGQIFIEINFYEGVDYDDSTGLLLINKNIQFYKDSPVNNTTGEEVQGLVYMVMSVVSSFSKGRFIQDLDLVQWINPNKTSQSSKNAEQGREVQNTAQNNTGATSVGFGQTSSENSTATPTNEPALTYEQTQQSIIATITANNATPVASTVGSNVSVAFNQQAAFYGPTVVDDDSINNIQTQPALSYAGINIEGRET